MSARQTSTGIAAKVEDGIDLAAVLAGPEVEIAPSLLPAAGQAVADSIDLSGLWTQMVFADDTSLDSVLGGGVAEASHAADAEAVAPLPVGWFFDPALDPPVDY